MGRVLRLLLVVALPTAIIYWIVGNQLDNWRTRQVRAELKMLRIIRSGVNQHFWQGGECPTNWLMLSNAIDSKAVTEFARYNGLGSPSELYTVLGKPVYHHKATATGLIFLVRSDPHSGEYWTLAMVNYGGLTNAQGDTNTEVFAWDFRRNELPPAIREQLEAQRKRR